MVERKQGPRPAVLGTCTFSPYPLRGPDHRDVLLREGLELLDAMAREADRQGESLDLVVWPEYFAQGEQGTLAEKAEPVDGRIVAAVAERTRSLGTNAAVPLALDEDGGYFNALVFLDRQGEHVGTYRKVNPVPGDDGLCEGGVTPGKDVSVFDLDIGRVGAQICFDGYFGNAWRELGRAGAELVVFSSAMQAVMGLKTHAYTNQYYVLASTWNVPTVIVDPVGREVARTREQGDVLVTRIDMDYRVYSDHRVEFVREIEEKYGGRVRMDWHPEELMWIVTSSDPDLPVAEFMQREQLDTTCGYLAEAGATLARIRGEGSVPRTVPGRG
jgi:predicted amidohydrolase